jgi:hypothetical protein
MKAVTIYTKRWHYCASSNISYYNFTLEHVTGGRTKPGPLTVQASVMISIQKWRLSPLPSAVICLLFRFPLMLPCGPHLAGTDSSWKRNKPRDRLAIWSCYAANFLLRWSSQPCVEEAEMFTLFAETEQSDFIVKFSCLCKLQFEQILQ